MSRRRRIVLIVGGGALGLCVVGFVLVRVLFDGYEIPTSAMTPTLEPGDRVLAQSVSGGEVDRGDIVIYRTDAPPFDRISRVVAIAGDEIGEEDGFVTIDGERADESYLPEGTTTPGLEPMTVPEGHVFLMGDNRDLARDSRLLGPVAEEDVRAVVVFRWWPLGGLGGV